MGAVQGGMPCVPNEEGQGCHGEVLGGCLIEFPCFTLVTRPVLDTEARSNPIPVQLDVKHAEHLPNLNEQPNGSRCQDDEGAALFNEVSQDDGLAGGVDEDGADGEAGQVFLSTPKLDVVLEGEHIEQCVQH